MVSARSVNSWQQNKLVFIGCAQMLPCLYPPPYYAHPVPTSHYVIAFQYTDTFERVRNKSTGKKIWDPAGNQTQDLLNTSLMILPLGHLVPWQRSGRQAQAAAPKGLSQIPTDSHSLNV